MTIALATGGRRLQLGREHFKLLDEAREKHGITEVWHGAAKGADEGVGVWARSKGLHVEEFPAPWKFGRSVGAKDKDIGRGRNVDMLEGRRRYVKTRPELGPGCAVHPGLATTERVEGKPSVCLVLHGNGGTRHMTRIAWQTGLACEYVYTEPLVINRYHYSGAGDRLPPNTVNIQRGTPLGNPFRVGDVAANGERITADNCMELYRRWLWQRIQSRERFGGRTIVDILADIPRDAHLACTCLRHDGSGLCHGHVVLAAWRYAHAPCWLCANKVSLHGRKHGVKLSFGMADFACPTGRADYLATVTALAGEAKGL